MKNRERYHFSDFTRENYRYLLRLAKQNYISRFYTNFIKEERFTIWRHDVDHSAHAAHKLTQIKTEERSTHHLLFPSLQLI